MTKVVLDHERCTGHGRCYALSPSLFADDDAGFALLRGDGDVPADKAGDARRAVTACPEQAITLEDGTA